MTDPLPVLCQDTLDQPALKAIAIPAYQRDGVVPGVVHLGLGAFNRAHQALVFDDLLARGDTRWGVLGVATRSWALADTLATQDGLYAVRLANAAGTSWRVVGSLLQTCAATRDPDMVHAAIANPATRWVTVTVTEKGYDLSLATLLVEGLRQRRDAGLGGLTIASCDNLSHNGDKLRVLCLEASTDTAFSDWLKRTCRFPNSMVDRIVPAATAQCAEEAAAVLGVRDNAALFSEVFWQWVIEDNFAQPEDGPVLSSAGVTVVADVGPYEDAKLRMLNGSHSALACIGILMGLGTVFEGVSHHGLQRFIRQLMQVEVMPNLTRPALPEYGEALLQRFANPEVKHGLHQIATDSSKKIGLRWVPSILAQLQAADSVEHHAFAVAAWMRYCLAEDDQGRHYAINDPQAADLTQLARTHQGNMEEMASAFLDVRAVWGEVLGRHPVWRRAVVHWLREIAAKGAEAALQDFLASQSIQADGS